MCTKCNVLKVDSVHHCSICGHCVYKMDHHCPWTNNCVGYMTLKPFCLFLFYVACLTVWGFMMAYKVSWKEGMNHCGLILPIVPSFGAKEYIMSRYFMNEQQRAEFQEENKREFLYIQKLESKPDQSWGDLWVYIRAVLTPNKWSPFYDWSNFLDYATMIGLFLLFCFTTQLLTQTIEYQVYQTSLIDQMKRQRDI